MHGHQAIVFLSLYISTLDRGALYGQCTRDCPRVGSVSVARSFLLGLCKNELNKWKSNFHEI